MKSPVNFVICMLFAVLISANCFAQGETVKTGKSGTIPPVTLSTGNQNNEFAENPVILNYLQNNLKYPEGSAEQCKQGTEVLEFTVLPDGNLANVKVINSVCPKIDKEVTRVLNTTNGMWKPVTQNGQPVETKKEISIMFHLSFFHLGSNDEYFLKKATDWYVKGNHALFDKKDLKKALKCYDNAMRYKPLDNSLLYARGMVKYELGDKTGARNDWDRTKELAARGENQNNLILVTEGFKDFSGYAENK